ncbi:nucleotidyltransferase family protein [Aristaeella hokkaidonensis]|uniref:Nucleotidyltransferase family protein n=1 Tax=Aristaeella hokkaidonensis TaxID=3046382 RepID=A0AC61MYM8_9FIRM|nr:nucleotidyltransferase family protein [Aristaeella hokkaidonensis]QUC68207.1 nucleotidyltransferase family protein [Aristaeella hokkaidonensis]SNT95233.1 Uncharacterised nucleotidyltransferase [Aristaeella hokkaidonensis]
MNDAIMESYDELEIIRCCIWRTNTGVVSYNTYKELRMHTIALLAAPILSRLEMPDDLRNIWKKYILQQMNYNIKYRYEQNQLPITVPYVILKGTSAAKYYPFPELRVMGDIDIMTRREDYETACCMLIKKGYMEIGSNTDEKNKRHREFYKNGIHVEVHQFFAAMNDLDTSNYLDNLIVSNIIADTHILPDLINGLVLLEHIRQHLRTGLGLRQIIDWIFFVDKCLDDTSKWSLFQKKANCIGLDKLAIIVTRMAEMYLGLSEHEWCKMADEELCNQLMNHIKKSGNFGNKQAENTSVGENVILATFSPKEAFRLFQKRGLINWKVGMGKKHLQSFAWVYQMLRYFYKGIRRKKPVRRLLNEYQIAKTKYNMFNKLGVNRDKKGKQ